VTKKTVAGVGERYGSGPCTLHRAQIGMQCALCRGKILKDELYTNKRVVDRDGAQHVAPACRECAPFHVVELISPIRN
jgi:hypothetical protein